MAITATNIKPSETTFHWLRIRPRAIPAAGGCSVSVATIVNIAIPTAKAPNAAITVDSEKKVTITCGNKKIFAVRCDPNTHLVYDVYGSYAQINDDCVNVGDQLDVWTCEIKC